MAIILVIAVPKVMSVIEDAKKATLESTAKMIASSAEKALVQNTILGNDETITCESITNINDVDYADCSIEFVDNTAKVMIEGSGKFAGLYVCNGTKTSATAQKEDCVVATNEACFEFDSSTGTILHYYLHENNDETQAECPLDVTIPKKINGVTVTKIGGNAFTDCESNACGSYSDGLGINSVNMPNTITEIGGFAFYDNQISGKLDLSKLTNLTTIDDSAFAYNNLSSVKLAERITSIGSSGFYKSNTSNLNLTTIINPSGNSFDWHNVTGQGTSAACTFVTGTCGSVTIKES